MFTDEFCLAAAVRAPDLLLHRGLQLFQTRQLPHVTDGRASAGPVDVAAFLAQPGVQEQVCDQCLILMLHFWGMRRCPVKGAARAPHMRDIGTVHMFKAGGVCVLF